MREESPKDICYRMAGLAMLAVAFCFFLFQGEKDMAQAVSGGLEEKPIYAVATTEKKIAFSFDATWGAEHTEEILDILDEYEVKTTFFLVNLWLDEYPEMARTIHERGHEIELHSASHPHFTELSTEAMAGELKENKTKIKETTGVEANLFRPPYGAYNNEVLATARNLGIEVVQWSVDSLDWQEITAPVICERVKKETKSGSIVLFHNNGLHTAAALKTLIPHFQGQGYEIVPVGDLLFHDNYTIDANGIQSKVE